MASREYQAEFYVPASGISREVITTDICKWLGPNAYVLRPQVDENGTIFGYFYMAYRALTDEMVRSMQENSARWAREKERNMKQTGQSGTYVDSASVKGSDVSELEYRTAPPPPPPPPHPALPGVMAEQIQTDRFIFIPEVRMVWDQAERRYLPSAGIPGPEPNAIPRHHSVVYHTPGPAAPVPGSLPPTVTAPEGYWTYDSNGQRVYIQNKRY